MKVGKLVQKFSILSSKLSVGTPTVLHQRVRRWFRGTGLEILVEILIATVNITVRYILKLLSASKLCSSKEGIPTDQLHAAFGTGRSSGTTAYQLW